MKNAQPDIRFYFQKQVGLRDRRRLKAAIAGIFKDYRKQVETLNIIFCSDEYLLDINRQHLNHDYYTDIITFNLAEPGNPIAGEIYISVDRVRENARKEGVGVAHELHRVVFHGVLHLCGLNDETAHQKGQMRKAEDKQLQAYVPREKR